MTEELNLEEWAKREKQRIEEECRKLDEYLAMERKVKEKGLLKCSRCGSESFIRFGWRRLKGRKIKQFQCVKCGFVYAVKELAVPLDWSWSG